MTQKLLNLVEEYDMNLMFFTCKLFTIVRFNFKIDATTILTTHNKTLIGTPHPNPIPNLFISKYFQ
jgi:hypothetical protein